MQFNPAKTLKNSLLRFVRYFYDEKAMYIDDFIEQWIKSFVRFILDILLNGFMFWLALVALISIFSIKVSLGPGYWHFLQIFQLGLIICFAEKTYKFIRGGYKK